jgi:hypothetical protein
MLRVLGEGIVQLVQLLAETVEIAARAAGVLVVNRAGQRVHLPGQTDRISADAASSWRSTASPMAASRFSNRTKASFAERRSFSSLAVKSER